MKKAGLVLAGGGGRGAYQVGVWKALRESGLEEYIDVVSGSSVGGLNAALFIQNDLDKAIQIWESLSMKKILTPKSESKNRSLALFERDGLEDIIDKDLDMRCFDNSGRNCWITCARVDGADNRGEETQHIEYEGKKVAYKHVRGRIEYFNLKYVKDDNTRKKIILATSAIPVVFPKEEIQGYHYGDGGARLLGGDNVPVTPLYDIEKCDIILIIHLTTIGTEKRVNKDAYPNAKLYEIFPKENPGRVPGIDGMFDFTAEGAVERMQLGYVELVNELQNIKKSIDSEMKMKEKMEWAAEREVKVRREIRAGMTNNKEQQEKRDMTDQELRKIINEQIKGWDTTEMCELLGECEFAMSQFEGRIEQLKAKGLRRLYHICIGIHKRNKQEVLDDISHIQRIANQIQIILIKRIDIVNTELIGLNEKVNTQRYWTKTTIENLTHKLSETDVRTSLLEWKSKVRNIKTENNKKYIEVSDGMKVLLVISDLFDIVHNRTELIGDDDLETVKEELDLEEEISIADFYKDIIYARCFPLYIKNGFSYIGGNISEYGQRICLIADFYEDEHIKKLSTAKKESIDDMCREAYIEELIQDGSRVNTVTLCSVLLDDLAGLYSEYQGKIAEQNRQKELLEKNRKEKEDRLTKTPQDSFIKEVPQEKERTEYSVLRLTPEGFWLFTDGGVKHDGIAHNWRYLFFDDTMKEIDQYLDKNSPYMVTAPTEYLNLCEKETKDFFLHKTQYISLADYFMYLWFLHEKKYARQDQKIAFIEYYDRHMYVFGYEINEAEDGYRKLFSGLKIFRTRYHGNIIKDIKNKFRENTLASDNDNILIFKTFIADAHIDKQLECEDVRNVEDEWEDTLKVDNAALGRIIIDMIEKSK